MHQNRSVKRRVLARETSFCGSDSRRLIGRRVTDPIKPTIIADRNHDIRGQNNPADCNRRRVREACRRTRHENAFIATTGDRRILVCRGAARHLRQHIAVRRQSGVFVSHCIIMHHRMVRAAIGHSGMIHRGSSHHAAGHGRRNRFRRRSQRKSRDNEGREKSGNDGAGVPHGSKIAQTSSVSKYRRLTVP